MTLKNIHFNEVSMQTIELSSGTLEIMKNFSTINPSIYIKKGSLIDTLSISNEILGVARVVEDFPDDIPIYDFVKFLNQLKLFSKPVIDVDMDNRYLYIRDANPEKQDATTRWIYSDPATIHRPKKLLKIPEAVVSFELPKIKLENILRAAQILGFENISIKPIDGKTISITVIDWEKQKGNQFKLVVPATIDPSISKFNFVFNINNLKILPNDYSIAISEKMYSHFFNTGVEYFIAIDKKSTLVKA